MTITTRTVIFGAGQAGFMVRRWLPLGKQAICFVDNNPKKQHTVFDGLQVLPLQEALALSPDEIWIAVLNRETVEKIRTQIKEAGFTGQVIDLSLFRKQQDIRLAALRLYAGLIKERNIPGAVAELGVYKGDTAEEINRLFPDRRQYYLDTFEGFTKEDLEAERSVTGQDHFRDFSDTGVELVKSRLSHPENAVLIKGHFPESAENLPKERYALVSLDADLYAPTLSGLTYFWPRLSKGGVILLHDYSGFQFPGVHQAAEEFMGPRGLVPVPLMDLHGTAILQRQSS